MSAAPDLTAVKCWHCDFGSGYRGMDTCSRCDGTGSVFVVAGQTYPNTREGYTEACAAAGIQPVYLETKETK